MDKCLPAKVAAFACLVLLTPLVAMAGKTPLQLIGSTTLPGYTGDFDDLAPDIVHNRLFMAAEDHGTLEIFNLKTGAHEKTLKTFSTPHAIVYLPKVNRLVVTDSGTRGTRVLDATTYKVVRYIKLEPGADAMAYAPGRGRVYIVTGGEDVGMKHCYLTEVDPLTGKIYRRREFDSDHTDAMAIEPHGRRMFVNIADKGYVAVINKYTLKDIARWPIEGAKVNLSMALDANNQRLFIVTRKPTRLFVINAVNGKQVAMFKTPAVVDAVFYDAKRRRIYVPGAVGEVGVFQQLDADHYRHIADVPSAKGAKSGVLAAALHRLYLGASPGKDRHIGELLWFNVGAQP